MIDCHAHLADESFQTDLDRVILRAEEAGVSAIVCVSEGLADADRVLALARLHPQIRPCLGLHPDKADLDEARTLASMIRSESDRLAAIGEVGLDYWVAKEDEARTIQREVLALFADLSKELDLPLNVHSRSAGRHALDLLKARGARRVLMHAFDGKAAYALSGVDAGFLFAVPPSVVRSPQKQKLVRRLPLESLVLETDSPVLGPDPQARNEPANARISAEAIAEIKSVALDEVIAVTTETATRFFRLDI